MSDILILFGGGILAGALGGLLGIGGGIVLMPILRFFVGLSPSHAAGTCVLAVFFTALGGSYRHYKLGNVNLRAISPIMISGALATVAFSFVFLYLSTRERWLDLGVGLVFILVSIRMIAEGIPGLISKREEEIPDNEIKGSLVQKSSIGFMAGVLPGLLGIGTGAVLVPAFIYALRATARVAMAASLVCFCLNALISSGLKYWQGFIALDVALPICAGTLLGAYLGAEFNKRISSRTLKLVFGLVFSYVSLRFILSFLAANP